MRSTFVSSNVALSMQYFRSNNSINQLFTSGRASAGTVTGNPAGGAKTVGRWLKDRKEKKKEETRAHNAQLHAAVSVAAVAAAIAAIAAATASSSASGRNEQLAKTDMAVASAATLVAAQCVEAAEAMGAERDNLASVVSSAVSVRSHDDIATLTAAAATGSDFGFPITKNFSNLPAIRQLLSQFLLTKINYIILSQFLIKKRQPSKYYCNWFDHLVYIYIWWLM